MGLLDFAVNITSAVVKTTLSPVAFVADVAIKVVTDVNPELASGAIRSAGKDIEQAMEDITP